MRPPCTGAWGVSVWRSARSVVRTGGRARREPLRPLLCPRVCACECVAISSVRAGPPFVARCCMLLAGNRIGERTILLIYVLGQCACPATCSTKAAAPKSDTQQSWAFPKSDTQQSWAFRIVFRFPPLAIARRRGLSAPPCMCFLSRKTAIWTAKIAKKI